MAVLEMTTEKQPQDCELCTMKEEEIQALVSRLRTAEEAITILEEQCRVRFEAINETISIAADFKAQRDKCRDIKSEEIEQLVHIEVGHAVSAAVAAARLSGDLPALAKESDDLEKDVQDSHDRAMKAWEKPI